MRWVRSSLVGMLARFMAASWLYHVALSGFCCCCLASHVTADRGGIARIALHANLCPHHFERCTAAFSGVASASGETSEPDCDGCGANCSQRSIANGMAVDQRAMRESRPVDNRSPERLNLPGGVDLGGFLFDGAIASEPLTGFSLTAADRCIGLQRLLF